MYLLSGLYGNTS